MTQEEKAKAYDEAIKRANELNYVSDKDSLQRKTVEHIFPQLKESDDERIRKEIIKYFKKYQALSLGDYNVQDIIAWLEKQGEQKQHLELKAGKWYICYRAYCCRADHLTIKEGERFLCEKDGVAKGFIINEPEKYFKEVNAPSPIENEQKNESEGNPNARKPTLRIIKGKSYLCIKDYQDKNCTFTKGKIYESDKDGFLVDDEEKDTFERKIWEEDAIEYFILFQQKMFDGVTTVTSSSMGFTANPEWGGTNEYEF